MQSPSAKHIAACSVLSLLAACGGGSNDGSTPPPLQPTGLTIDSGKQQTAAAAGAQAIFDTSHAVNAVGGTSILSTASTAPGGVLALNIARDALRKTIQKVLPTAAGTQQPTRCADGGTYSIQWNDANNNKLFDTGDSFTYVYQACAVNGVNTDGTIVLGLEQFQQTGNDINAILNATFTNFSVQDSAGGNRLNGAMRLTTAGIQGNSNPNPNGCDAGMTDASFDQITTDDLAANRTVLRSTVLKNGHITSRIGVDCSIALTVTESATGTWSNITGTLAIATPSTIVTAADGVPYAGSYTVAADNGKILVSFTNGGASLLQLDANGDGSYESSTSLIWTDLGVN